MLCTYILPLFDDVKNLHKQAIYKFGKHILKLNKLSHINQLNKRSHINHW
jgi:hypothetical protein